MKVKLELSEPVYQYLRSLLVDLEDDICLDAQHELTCSRVTVEVDPWNHHYNTVLLKSVLGGLAEIALQDDGPMVLRSTEQQDLQIKASKVLLDWFSHD